MTSLKQRVKSAQGKEVHLDYFLYSCLERERMLKHLGAQYWQEFRWPVLDSALHGESGSPRIQSESISDLIKDLAQWYAKTFESIRSTKPLDYEHLNEVLPPFVDFTHDLVAVVHLKTGHRIPVPTSTEAADSSFWMSLRESVKSSFPGYAHLFTRYLEWAYAPEMVEEHEIGSRPPVGRWAPPMRLRQGGTGPGSRPPRSDSRGPAPRSGNRSGPPPAREPRNFDRGGDRGGERPPQRGPRQDFKPSRDEGPQRDRPRRPRGGDDGERSERSASLERAAMDDLNEALSKLRADPALEGISLKPTNSYYRRLQHKQAVEEGFNSSSVGEGPERAVRIARESR
jgi:hypothetical protein